MKIIDPQTATLTNIEVLSYLTSNPPRKSPEGPPNFKNYEPKPDLRLHCSVVTEIHNYVERSCPHLLSYPRYTHESKDPDADIHPQPSTDQQRQQPYIQPTEPTPLDNALRKLIQDLAPYNLTKGEVMMLINLGVGLRSGANDDTGGGGMEVDGAEGGNEEEEKELQQQEQQQEGEEGGEEGEEDDPHYTDKVVMTGVIEDMSERLSDEDVLNILMILNENLGSRES